MSTVFTGSVARTLKKTLSKIIDDKSDGLEGGAIFKKYLEQGDTEEAWVDHLEVGGPGLASDVPEGAEIPLGTIREGTLTRYIMRKVGMRLAISDEAMEDCQYEEVLKAARRLKRALWKTFEYDAALLLARAWNTSYAGGDGLPLCSASHTLPGGGTFSNTLATPLGPSRAALLVVRAAVRKFPGHDGLIEGYKAKKVVCPTEQLSAWEEIVGSKLAPETGEFNRINIANKMGIEVVEVPYWTSTTTNWIVITDADDGPKWIWRRHPRSTTEVDNQHEIMNYMITARIARGWSDARGVLGSQA
jgi:hypothetical protein